MTDTVPPPMPDFPPPAPEPPAPKKSRTHLIVIASAAAVIAAVIGTGIVVVQSGDDDSKSAAAGSTSSAPDDDTVTAAAEEPDPSPVYDEVDADDFTIELRTTARQCFGSAGCNVTVEPDLTYLGDSQDIDPDAAYRITYEIHGDESGPVIETAELSDRTSLNYTPSLISTASAGTNVSVEITAIATQG
ncbi:hypothetical protein [Streptomyces pseudovenezuelae]|uniref:Uncharacterized protein n=1 Tax=Streptomyces pseudovenezuelae TaxID=67350 RepID=A0ABT6LLZ0_9ACTN|nr:hypothetical protein [Streptomyces pseudovenezuelae]MDH6216970.1 hypothetical protein [Streptomyces pseudovenezuelae]